MPKAHTARRGSQYGGKGLLVPLKNLYVRTKAVQHIVQHGTVAVYHHPLRLAYKGVNGILRLMLLRLGVSLRGSSSIRISAMRSMRYNRVCGSWSGTQIR